MSLNGLMGIGLSSGGTLNPWDANSAVAVDFRRSELIDARGEVKERSEPSVPVDYVTLHSGEVQVGSRAAQVNESGSRFQRVA